MIDRGSWGHRVVAVAAVMGGGCVSSQPGVAACAMPVADAKELALSVSEDVFLRGEPATGVLADDFVAHFPGGQPDQNLEGFLGFATQFRAALPDAAFTFTHVISDGTFVGMRYVGTGTHRAELFGIPATNRALRWEGMVIRRIAGGRVVEEWNEPDNAGLFAQLAHGAPPPTPHLVDHRSGGDCAQEVVASRVSIARRVSTEVVLGGSAPETLLSPSFVMHNPNGLPDADLAGFLAFNAGLRTAFPDAAFELTHEVGEGDLVMIRYTATGTHRAEFLGVAATDRRIAWEGTVIRRIEGERVEEEWNAPDLAGILAQLSAP